jgi:hypothetical protein
LNNKVNIELFIRTIDSGNVAPEITKERSHVCLQSISAGGVPGPADRRPAGRDPVPLTG